MKIVFLAPYPSWNGGSRVIVVYANELRRRGHEVLIYYKVPSLSFRVKRALKKISRFHFWDAFKSLDFIRDSHYRWLENVEIIGAFNDCLNFYDISEKVNEKTIFIATWWETAEVLNQFPVDSNKKYYFIQHMESMIEFCPTERVENTYSIGLNMITISTWISRAIKDLGVSDSISVVPNAVDHEIFYADSTCRRVSSRFCAMFSTVSFKGVDVTLAAFEKAKKINSNISLVLFCSDELPIGYRLPDGVSVVVNPSRSKLRQIYSSSAAYIFSSRCEGFGLTILEALACGCSVVATKTGCAEDFIKDGVNGFLSDIDDFDKQAEGILKISYLSEKELHDYSENSADSVRTCSWELSADLFENSLLGCKG